MSATVSHWHPMTDPVDLKHLGKLGEEAGELGAIVSRCIIQGVNGCHPLSGKPNKHALQEECADVLANIALVLEHFNLSLPAVYARRAEKIEGLKKWHDAA